MTQRTGGPQWTEAQNRTIEERDKNILVSAAAGSGKTAVLVERIKKLLIEDKQDIGGFLITTFTKAAAEEMKQRLEGALKEELKHADAEERKFLSKQMFDLPGASISTFHSFCIEIIRQYFYLTDLEPGFKIVDEIQGQIMAKEAMDELFDIRFEENSDEFKYFLKGHSSDRDDKALKEHLQKTYDALRSIPYYMEWAASRVELMNTDDPFKTTGALDVIIESSLEEIDQAVSAFKKAANYVDTPQTKDIWGKAMTNVVVAEDLANTVKAYVREKRDQEEIFRYIASAISGIKWQSMTAKKAEKEFYEPVKDKASAEAKVGRETISNIGKKYFGRSIDSYNQEIRQAYADTKYFLGMLIQFEEILSSKKAEEGAIDFNDVMHITIGILEDDKAAEELREKYRYIFVDEYQDSNDIQETIIGRIKRDNNLFMVGDVKQSIYKFRQAEPELFMKRDHLYRNCDDELSTVIDLNANFRSKSSVTESVNAVFEACMEGYGEEAALHCSIDHDPGHRTEIHILETDKIKEHSGFITKQDGETILVADLIEKYIGTEFYDSKKQVTRPITYKDIAVLTRGKSIIAGLEHYLTGQGIPAYGEQGDDFFETVELQVFMNILKVINNMMQDIPLISVMRSVLFGFTTKELAEIRIAFREESYAGAVMRYMEEGKDEALRNKIAEMVAQIEKWRMISRAVPVAQLVQTLLYDTGYFDYCSGLPAGSKRTSNLRLLIEKAIAYEEKSRGGLYGFLSYADAVSKSEKTDSEAKTISESENVVRIMTVHKSKGLEFPIVILVGAGKSISGGGNKRKPLHKKLGMCLKISNREHRLYKKTILQTAIEEKQKLEETEEEVRILYVALTRAQDRLVIVGSVSDASKIKETSTKSSFMDLVHAPLTDKNLADVTVYDRLVMPGAHAVQVSLSLDELMQRAERADYRDNEEVARRLDFVYPYESDENVKLKYSVSELGVGHGESRVPLAQFSLETKAPIVDAATAGTAMHYIMELIDFCEAAAGGTEYIENFADSLVERELMSPEERKVMNCSGINAFFTNEVGKRAAAAFARRELRREKEFILQKEISGTDAIVQGIIDCWFVEDGEIVLIDYKNSNMNGRTEEDVIETYKEQIHLYTEALEESTGLRVKESYLYLFGPSKFISIERER